MLQFKNNSWSCELLPQCCLVAEIAQLFFTNVGCTENRGAAQFLTASILFSQVLFIFVSALWMQIPYCCCGMLLYFFLIYFTLLPKFVLEFSPWKQT